MRAWFSALSVFGKGFVGAIVGTAIVLLLIHLYVDHLAFHQLVDMVNAASKQATPPARQP